MSHKDSRFLYFIAKKYTRLYTRLVQKQHKETFTNRR